MPNLKGTGWRSVQDYFLQQAGPAGIAKVMEALDPQDREIFARPILPISWIDYGAYFRYLLAADRILGRGDLEMIRAASRHAARYDLHGIYKIFISLTSPKFVIQNSARLWRQYYDAGEVTVEWRGEKSGALYLAQFADMPLHHENNHQAYMEECLRLSSCKEVRGSHPQCLARRDARCAFEFSWE